MADDINPKKIPPPLPSKGIKGPALPGKAPGPLPSAGTPKLPAIRRPGGPSGGMPVPPPGPRSGPPAPSGPSNEKFKKMEDQSQALEEAKRKLERTVAEMEMKLKDEKEKSLTQAIKAREEESLSLKMEQALKEMQEKTRIARREQEQEDARSKAEDKVKDLERRLNEERETWVINLKKQMEVRDSDTNQMEVQLENRFHDLEKRWQEERTSLSNAIKNKDEELLNLRHSSSEAQFQQQRAMEDFNHTLEVDRNKAETVLQSEKDRLNQEKKNFSDRCEMREKELVSIKAQIAMIDSQVRATQESTQKSLQEKEKYWASQTHDLQTKLDSLTQLNNHLDSSLKELRQEEVRLKREVSDWQNKAEENKAYFREVETKNQTFSIRMENEIDKKNKEYELLEKRMESEKESWIQKSEDKRETEESLRQHLFQTETEMSALRSELVSLEPKIRNHYEAEKNDKVQKIEHELALLRSDKNTVEQRLWGNFEREKNSLTQQYKDIVTHKERELSNLERNLDEKFKQTQRELMERQALHYEEEMSLKAELTHRELSTIRETIMSELAQLEEQMETEKTEHLSDIRKKETEAADNLSALKEMETELRQERSIRQNEFKRLNDQFKTSETESAQNHNALEEERRRNLEYKKEISFLQEEQESLRKIFENKQLPTPGVSTPDADTLYDVPESTFSSSEQSVTSSYPPDSKTIWSKIWRYLNRTVVVVSLRAVPRIKKR